MSIDAQPGGRSQLQIVHAQWEKHVHRHKLEAHRTGCKYTHEKCDIGKSLA